MRQILNTSMLCLLFLATSDCVSAEWTITKDGGAYRVNGCKLMANGKLVDRNGVTVRNLTPQEQAEISQAINRHEPPAASADRQYAEHKSRQPTQSAPPDDSPPRPSPANPEQKSTERYNSTPADESTSKSKPSVSYAIFLLGLAGAGFFLLKHLFRPRCPRCNSDAIRNDGARVLDTRHSVAQEEETRTATTRDRWGNPISTTEYSVPVTRVYERNLVEDRYSCFKCRHKWSTQNWQ
jgi:hypothetical protein